jgi:hypothetical protein
VSTDRLAPHHNRGPQDGRGFMYCSAVISLSVACMALAGGPVLINATKVSTQRLVLVVLCYGMSSFSVVSALLFGLIRVRTGRWPSKWLLIANAIVLWFVLDWFVCLLMGC